MSRRPTILAIESSCDETAAAVIQDGHILSNIVASQDIHQRYGGVVPELASRAHQQHIVIVVKAAMDQAGITSDQLDAVACTQGPGLMGPLLVGLSFSKALALAWDIPLITVNHLQAHVLAHFIEEPRPSFPFLCLTVSGGHTQLILVHDYLQMEVIGETQDDAAGEVFDKAAKLMGLPYPGGHLIDRYAKEGNPQAFSFPLADVPDLNFSFSGVKTALLYFLQDALKKDDHFIEKNRADICASFQHTVVQMLVLKVKKAVKQTNVKSIAIAGGVAANSALRDVLNKWAHHEGIQWFAPRMEYCTDNAAMIAMAAHVHYLNGHFATQDVVPEVRQKR